MLESLSSERGPCDAGTQTSENGRCCTGTGWLVLAFLGRGVPRLVLRISEVAHEASSEY